MKNKINKKIFIVIIFVLFFYKILITEAYTTTIVPTSTGEGDIYVVKSYEAPKNNEIRVGDSAMFTFHIYLKELDYYEKRDKVYNPMYLYFVGNADNETLSVDKDKENVAVKQPSERVAIAGTDKKFYADVASLGKPGSKSYTWFLLDNNIIDSNNKRKVVASGSFTFKKDLQWYNQVQIKEPTQTSFDTNGPFSTEAECKTNLALQLKQKNYDWQYSTYQICKQSLDMPIESTVQNIKPVAGSAVSNEYKFLAPLGTMDKIDTTDIGKYFNWIFNLAIGLCAALAVVMIIVGGVQYMGEESVFSKTDAKDRITKAIYGLLIAIGSWVLLNTINPALTGKGGVSVSNVSVSVSDATQYRLIQTQNIAGAKTFKRSPYYSQIKTISTKEGVPHCLTQVAIQRESGGVSSVGHDEDVPNVNVPSRRDFIASGKKFDGTTFTQGNKDDPKITQSDFKNSDHPSSYTKALKPSAADLGLDWRFSHSVGMFGVTFGPNHLPQSGAKAIYTDSNTDITKAVSILKSFYKQCSSSIDSTWRAYNSGTCTGNNKFTNDETAIRNSLYSQCVNQDN